MAARTRFCRAESSQALYDRAGEPKTIKIIPGVGHGLAEAKDEVFDLVSDWLITKGLKTRGGYSLRRLHQCRIARWLVDNELQ